MTKKVRLQKAPLFYTPKNMKELEQWLSQLYGSEAVIATTAAMMAWNLACELTNPGGGPELKFVMDEEPSEE